MGADFKTKVVYVVLSVAISFGGIYFMVAPLDQKANSLIKTHLESPCYGPFDEALAKSAGMEDILAKKPKWKPSFPEAKPFEMESIGLDRPFSLDRFRD